VPDLQRADLRRFGVARLQPGDDAPRFIAQGAGLVERRVIARAHKAAVALERRQAVGQRGIELPHQRLIGTAQRRDRIRHLGRGRRQRVEAPGEIGGGSQPVAHRREIARPAAPHHQPGKRAGEIGRGREPRAHVAAQDGIGEAFDRVEPPRDGVRIGERRGQPLGEEARARRRHGAVDGVDQRAAPLAGERAHELEIGAGRLVDRQRGAGGLAQRRRQRRALADLRALDIGHAGGRGGQLEPRQDAERIRGRDRKVGRQPPLGGGAVEHVAGDRRHRQGAQVWRELRIGIQRIRHDDLARLEPGDGGRHGGAVALGDAELAGRDVDPGEREPAVVLARGARAGERQQVVVALRVEQRILGQGAGRHQPGDVAPHHALGPALLRLGRVLELLADGDAVAERNQAVEVLFRALDRHAAHRNVAAEMLAALGQHDVERAARDLGVGEEQLVEIAHPVEQEAIRIGLLDLDVLLHHRGDAPDIVGRYGGDAADIVDRHGGDAADIVDRNGGDAADIVGRYGREAAGIVDAFGRHGAPIVLAGRCGIRLGNAAAHGIHGAGR